MRILLATHGSTGDLAPLLPVRDALERDGHEACFLVPKFLALHLRRLSCPHLSYVCGAEDSIRRDAGLFTTRFDGWASWRRLAVDHLAPALADDTARAGQVLDTWHPDVVVTTTLAVAPRVAAFVRGVAQTGLSLHPMLARPGARRGAAFAHPWSEAVRAVAGLPTGDPMAASLAWGAGPDVAVLHDPSLGHEPATMTRLLGYPYWDAFPAADDDLERADEAVDHTGAGVVLCTLGSLVRRAEVLDAITSSLRRRDLQVLVTNAGRRSRAPGLAHVGFVPLSRVASRCSVVVHHGGIGTLMGAIRAGKPSVIVPQAFDQCHNARIAEHARLGMQSSPDAVGDAVDAVLAADMTDAVRRAAARLISPEEAVRGACRHITTVARATGTPDGTRR